MLQRKIEYPVPVDALSVDGRPLNLCAPTPIVEAAEPMLSRGSRIVDLGAGRGANGLFLAMHGHEVISVESSRTTVEEGQRISRSLGSSVMSHIFVRADMCELDLESEFGRLDAVLAMRSLQQVSKPQAQRMVDAMQAATNPGGMNAVLAYIARPDQQAAMPHRAFFEPGQLEADYEQARWDVAMNRSQLHELDDVDGRPFCRSTVELIAIKPTEFTPGISL